jgi:hypothetical protein
MKRERENLVVVVVIVVVVVFLVANIINELSKND